MGVSGVELVIGCGLLRRAWPDPGQGVGLFIAPRPAGAMLYAGWCSIADVWSKKDPLHAANTTGRREQILIVQESLGLASGRGEDMRQSAHISLGYHSWWHSLSMRYSALYTIAH